MGDCRTRGRTIRGAHPTCRTRRLRLGLALAALTLLGAGPAGATTVLPDPVGDHYLFVDPLPGGLPPLPDLIEVTAGYTATHLHMTASFAPGTMVPGTPEYFFTIELDTDLDAATGGSYVPGADKVILLATSMAYGTICDDLVVMPFNCSTQVPVSASPDHLSLAIPLGTGGLVDDGVVRFGWTVGLFSGGGPVGADSAYDGTSTAEKIFTVQSTPVVPEPHTGLLVLAGMSGLAARRRRRRRG